MTRPGTMRTTVAIQSATEADDAHHEPIPTWVTVWVGKADIEQLSGRELVQAQEVQADISTRIRIRYPLGETIDPKHRVARLLNGTISTPIWDIRAVIPKPGHNPKNLELLCTEHRAEET